MLEDSIKARIRALYTHLSEQPGFRPRPAQRKMIGATSTHLASITEKAGKGDNARPGPVAVVEGPTGVGKTLGYLLATVPVAQARKKKVVIATATVPLQQQIIEWDLPRLQTKDDPLDVAIAKGRRRYACITRLRHLGSPQSQSELFEAGAENPFGTETLNPAHAELLERWESGAWDGERDSLDKPISDTDWHAITTDRNGCLGSRCSAFRACPFFAARKVVADADVIIANHDLVLSDLALGGGAVLPAPDQVVYVFDEAHHLPDKVLNHAAQEHSVHGARRWLEQGHRQALAAIQSLPSRYRDKIPLDQLEEAFTSTSAKLLDLSFPLDDAEDAYEGDAEHATWRLKYGPIPKTIADAGEALRREASALETGLRKVWEELNSAIEHGDITPQQAEVMLPPLAAFLDRVTRLVNTWRLFLTEDKDDQPPMARWIQREQQSNGVPDYRICASPISAAEPLNKLVWNRCAGAVLTSATLSALGRFDRFMDRAGLSHHDNVLKLALPSPFDYANKATLEIPALDSDPKDVEAHTLEITQWADQEISRVGGTLMLFSSYRQMRAVRDGLPKALKKIVLMQGDQSRHELLQQHKKQIDAGKGSLLMGVRSLAEGVDLPGDYCTHVVIAKLPFAVPDSPVEATTAEWFERSGRNPFFEITLPDASVQLTQMVGRLLRTEQDSGRITILDRRLVTRRYGRNMMDALPPMRRAIATSKKSAA